MLARDFFNILNMLKCFNLFRLKRNVIDDHDRGAAFVKNILYRRRTFWIKNRNILSECRENSFKIIKDKYVARFDHSMLGILHMHAYHTMTFRFRGAISEYSMWKIDFIFSTMLIVSLDPSTSPSRLIVFLLQTFKELLKSTPFSNGE